MRIKYTILLKWISWHIRWNHIYIVKKHFLAVFVAESEKKSKYIHALRDPVVQDSCLNQTPHSLLGWPIKRGGGHYLMISPALQHNWTFLCFTHPTHILANTTISSQYLFHYSWSCLWFSYTLAGMLWTDLFCLIWFCLLSMLFLEINEHGKLHHFVTLWQW